MLLKCPIKVYLWREGEHEPDVEKYEKNKRDQFFPELMIIWTMGELVGILGNIVGLVGGGQATAVKQQV